MLIYNTIIRDNLDSVMLGKFVGNMMKTSNGKGALTFTWCDLGFAERLHCHRHRGYVTASVFTATWTRAPFLHLGQLWLFSNVHIIYPPMTRFGFFYLTISLINTNYLHKYQTISTSFTRQQIFYKFQTYKKKSLCWDRYESIPSTNVIGRVFLEW